MVTTRSGKERAGVFDQLTSLDQEELVFFHHSPSRLKAIVAIDNTALGPALGGMRMFPYASEKEAIQDALRLARAMTYKAAVTGLNFGGGKAVIIGDPRTDKSEELFRAFGRFVHSLGGRYITSTDVGTTVEDLIIVRQETPYVTGLPVDMGGGGDTSIATATGVWKGMKVFAKEVFGKESLAGLRIVVQGVGKVGKSLLPHLVDEGAKIFISDRDRERLKRVSEEFPSTIISPDEAYSIACDIFSPNGLGGVLNDETIPLLRCPIVAGAANNQLAEPRHGYALHKRKIWYAPDYVINAGGLINVCDELQGYCQPRAWRQIDRIAETLAEIISISKEKGVPTSEAADWLAQKRIKMMREVQRIYVPATYPARTGGLP
ncbi:MAG: Glu/Leu/Phe/Val dehydrogenase [Chloroflexi bacterium]|nr:Glu/Leu/Phe/Val dehydrogenase [Chloroflexota bacterium]